MRGLIVGTSMMAGSWVAKRFLSHLGAEQFRLLMDCAMLVAGLTLLWGAL